MVILVQGRFKAVSRPDLTNRIFNIIFCMEYSPYVNSVVYTIG